MNLIDPNHPFFAPAWRRYAVVASCLGWAAVEFLTGGAFWGVLFGALGVYSAWMLIVAYKPPQAEK